MKLVGYIRVSTLKQTEKFGPQVQRESIMMWAKANGHSIVDWQQDEISGTSELASRAGWLLAEQQVKAKSADGIVVARMDRLARDVLVQELLLRNLTLWGGVIASARESENELLSGESKDPSRKLIRTILGAVSEYDREMVTDRLEAARRAKARCGGYAHGALPYGYRSVRGRLEPDRQEQSALKRMRTLASQGFSTRAIAEALSAEGFPTKRGGVWSSPVVSRILKRNAQAVS